MIHLIGFYGDWKSTPLSSSPGVPQVRVCKEVVSEFSVYETHSRVQTTTE